MVVTAVVVCESVDACSFFRRGYEVVNLRTGETPSYRAYAPSPVYLLFVFQE